jgi:hypothetical protein
VPNLDFYAVDDDEQAVVSAVFDLGLFRIFEAYSEPDNRLREFTAAQQVPEKRGGRHLMLYAVGSGPEPTAGRLNLRPGALGDATFRYSCQGWGLIQLHFGRYRSTNGELEWSHTNHNTEKRAWKWFDVTSELGDPGAWDWSAVTRASSNLNRVIRSMAIIKVGSHPVLPQAGELINRAGLRYEYGSGIHANPSPAMSLTTEQ